MSDSDIIQDFLVESAENLDRLDRELVGLEKNPQDNDALAGVFRTIHTIKGTCGFLGFNKLEKVAHVGENLLTRLRDGQLKLNPEITTALLSMVDAIRKMLSEIETTGQDGSNDYPELRETLTRLQSMQPGPASLAEPSPAKKAPEVHKPKTRASESLESARPDSANTHAVPETAREQPATASTAAQTKAREGTIETIRVAVTLLDKLMTLVGELVLARNQLLQFSNTVDNTGLHAICQRLNLIASELQEDVMKTRMQPIGNIWSQFPRTVRDVALGCGKQVNIEMEGKDTELDKTIIEAIKDPLTHLVRNSVDHGIESPQDRVRAGKDPAGRLVLRAFHEGGQVNIEITDDGAGLNLNRIRQKAAERKLITSEQAARMSEREIFNLIFLPGFSTAEKVTNVSGRGVGMDVVRTNVEKIGGAVDLQSTPGQGTTVRIKIPLTLAIIPALIVNCGEERYAIPQVNLLELVRLEGEQARAGIEMVHGVPVHRLRGKLLPLVHLSRELKVDRKILDTDASTAAGLDFSMARDKHRQWIETLQQVLDGKSSQTAQEAGSYEQCALGKWIYSSGLKDYAAIEEMHTLEKTHKHFHELVHSVFHFKSARDEGMALQQLEKVKQASEEIVHLTSDVERKVLEFRNVNIVVLQADERQFGLVVDSIGDTEEIVVKPLRKQLKSVKTFAGSSIMGDGRVALILDVLGLAQRASVVSETRDRSVVEKAAESVAAAAEKQTFLLFAGLGDSRMAIPLSILDRLEEFPVEKIEISGMQWVTQYRGQILPLVRLNVVMEERRHKLQGLQAQPPSGQSQVQVLVLNHEGYAFGLIVDRILDIVEDRADVKSAATRACVHYSVVIGERVTELLDIAAIVKRNMALTVAQPSKAMHAAGGAN